MLETAPRPVQEGNTKFLTSTTRGRCGRLHRATSIFARTPRDHDQADCPFTASSQLLLDPAPSVKLRNSI